jgi:hypothetical protein
MEHEGSLPCSATGPYPEPYESNRQPTSKPYSPEIYFNIVLLRSLPSSLFTSGFLTKILCAFLISPQVTVHSQFVYYGIHI